MARAVRTSEVKRPAAKPVSRTQVTNADPLVESTTPPSVASPPQMDYPAHVATYNRFLNMVKWFMIHMCFLIPALYFFIIQGSAGVGFTLLAIGIAVLIWGLLHNPKVDRDVDVAMRSREA